ncbi:MAG: hypothetical protein LW704_04440 [Cryomorphaceae bacterium]|nr:hypothetical protein [Cryomorphaceae bacterium]
METNAMEKSALRIIVLDDDPFLGKLVHSFLQKHGYTNSMLVDDESECIRLAESGHNLVILDYDLKTIKGLENEYVTNWCDRQTNQPIDLIDFRSRLNRA